MPITSDQWRKSIPTETITLPSGAEVVVRKNKLRVLMAKSILPLMAVGGEGPREKQDVAAFVEGFSEACAVVCQIVVEPRIVMRDAKDGEMLISDIPDSDLMALIQFSLGGSADAVSFRSEGGVGVNPGSAGEQVSPATVSTNGAGG